MRQLLTGQQAITICGQNVILKPLVLSLILHCITGLNVGGAELMLARYLGLLDKAIYPSSILSLLKPGPVEQRIKSLGIELISLHMTETRAMPMDFIKLGLVARRTRPALIHGWMYHGNLAASLCAFIAPSSPPVIWSVHHSLSDISVEKSMTQRIIRLSAKLSSRTAAISYCSKVAAADHERQGYDPARGVIIPNGIDCQEFRPSADARHRLIKLLGIPNSRFVIGNVARFHLMKDQANLVRAVAKLLDRGYDVQGVIIGAGHDDHGPVRQAARELGIDTRITTLGARSDISDLMPGMDIYALSSAWGEAFPLAVTEAMACGVPAVVTAVGDCDWLVGDTGKIVPPLDPDALASAMAYILDMEPVSRRELGNRARQRVIQNFSLQQYASRHEALYEEALGSCNPNRKEA